MTPEELAVHHPRLYHVTEPGAWDNIQRNGLLSTTHLLTLFEIENSRRQELETQRRPSAVLLEHRNYGCAILNDQFPLSERALLHCLDDNLTPSDWIRLLNARVFFWASEEGLNRHLGARLNRQREREVIVIDTLSMAKTHSDRMELCAINSGATLRKAPRRGLNTFTSMLHHNYKDWCKLRGRHDKVREVTVHDHVLDIASHTVEILRIPTP
jgi:hypothetical protein